MYDRIRITALITKMLSVYLHYLVIFDLLIYAAELPNAGWRERLILLGAIVISYIFRERFSRTIGIIIVHIVMIIGICFIVPVSSHAYILSVMVGIEAIFAGGYIISGYTLTKDSDIPWTSFVLLVFASGYAVYLKNMSFLRETFIIGISIYLLYILLMYLINLEDYIRAAKNASKIPFDKMLPMNSVIVLCIFTIMTVTVILADKLGMGDALWGFLTSVLKIIVMVIRLVTIFVSFISSLFRGGTTGSEDMGEQMMLIEETIEDPSLLDDIVYFLLKLIVLAIAVYAIIRIFRAIYRYLLTRRLKAAGDAIVKLPKPDMSKTKKEKIVKEAQEGYFTPEQKARRIYKKRIETVKKKYTPARNHTAGDIKELYNQADEQLRPDKAHDITELTELYEAVRYGNVHPDPKYLKKMQNS